jgi:hypothetical protein
MYLLSCDTETMNVGTYEIILTLFGRYIALMQQHCKTFLVCLPIPHQQLRQAPVILAMALWQWDLGG